MHIEEMVWRETESVIDVTSFVLFYFEIGVNGKIEKKNYVEVISSVSFHFWREIDGGPKEILPIISAHSPLILST